MRQDGDAERDAATTPPEPCWHNAGFWVVGLLFLALFGSGLVGCAEANGLVCLGTASEGVRDAEREIGGALVAGSLVGLALVGIQESIEHRREAAAASRHRAAERRAGDHHEASMERAWQREVDFQLFRADLRRRQTQGQLRRLQVDGVARFEDRMALSYEMWEVETLVKLTHKPTLHRVFRDFSHYLNPENIQPSPIEAEKIWSRALQEHLNRHSPPEPA